MNTTISDALIKARIAALNIELLTTKLLEDDEILDRLQEISDLASNILTFTLEAKQSLQPLENLAVHLVWHQCNLCRHFSGCGIKTMVANGLMPSEISVEDNTVKCSEFDPMI